MLAAGDSAVMLFARQWLGGMNVLPPRNGAPPNKYGTVYDAEQRPGLAAGSGTDAVTGPLTNALIVGSAPAALNAPSLGVCATVCLRSRPLLGGSALAGGFSSVNVNSRSSHHDPSAISLVRIWLIAFWLPLVGAAPWRTTLSVIVVSCALYAAVKPGCAARPVHCRAQSTTASQPVRGTPYSKIVVNRLRPHDASVPPPHGLGWTTLKMKRSSPAVTGTLVAEPP